MTMTQKNAACIILIEHLYTPDDLLAPSEVARTLGNIKEDPYYVKRRLALGQYIKRYFEPDNVELDENGKVKLCEKGKYILKDPNKPRFSVYKWSLLLDDEDRRKAYAYLKEIHKLPAIYLLDAKAKDVATIFEILKDPIQQILSNSAEANAQAALNLLRRPLLKYQKEAPEENARAVIKSLKNPLDQALQNASSSIVESVCKKTQTTNEQLRKILMDQKNLLESIHEHQSREVKKLDIFVNFCKGLRFFKIKRLNGVLFRPLIAGIAIVLIGFLLPAAVSASKYNTNTLFTLFKHEGLKAFEFIYSEKIGATSAHGNEYILALAAAYYEKGEMDKAFSLLESVLSQDNLPTLDRARANFSKSKWLMKSNSFEEASNCLLLSQEAYREVNYSKAEPYIQLEWARLYFFQELYDESLQELGKFENTGLIQEDINFLYMWNYATLHDYDKAIYYASALVQSRNINFRIGALNMIAYINIRLGDLDNAYSPMIEANQLIFEYFGDSDFAKYNRYIQWLYGKCMGKDSEAVRSDLLQWYTKNDQKKIIEILEKNICPN